MYGDFMDKSALFEDNEKLINSFGAGRVSDLADKPDFYTFTKGLAYSHRDFDRFYKNLKAGKKVAILSGVNASGQLHLGHKGVFDTVKYFQQEHGVPIFIPISDDESYICKKVQTQEEGLNHAMRLAKELLALGLDPKNTFIFIDQIYTNIYNLAIKLCRRVTTSEIKAAYGYELDNNPGMFFYPAIQSAHILYPIIERGFDDVLVPIGPDEDSHIRIGRDIASRMGVTKPAILHLLFMPGVDGEKMSKSRNNTILLGDAEKAIRKTINKALSGGQETVELHRELGGDPDKDVACFYLEKYFLSEEETSQLYADYRAGKLLSGEVKKMLADHVVDYVKDFQEKLETISDELVDSVLLKNA